MDRVFAWKLTLEEERGTMTCLHAVLMPGTLIREAADARRRMTRGTVLRSSGEKEQRRCEGVCSVQRSSG
jgi:hypothetical protein